MHYNIIYNVLTAPHYSSVGEQCPHSETKTLELNTPKNSLFLFNRNPLERNWEQIVIRTNMYMTKNSKEYG